MFIFNLSLNKKSIKKALSVICCFLTILILIFCFYFNKSKKIYVKDEMPTANALNISNTNYAEILDDCYNNLDNYVGKTINYTGFIYKLYDFSENQFVLGREMIIAKLSETQAQSIVIGFLCESKKTQNFQPGDWVEIEGTIEKGYYHKEIPIIKIKSINKTQEPENPYIDGTIPLSTT